MENTELTNNNESQSLLTDQLEELQLDAVNLDSVITKAEELTKEYKKDPEQKIQLEELDVENQILDSVNQEMKKQDAPMPKEQTLEAETTEVSKEEVTEDNQETTEQGDVVKLDNVNPFVMSGDGSISVEQLINENIDQDKWSSEIQLENFLKYMDFKCFKEKEEIDSFTVKTIEVDNYNVIVDSTYNTEEKLKGLKDFLAILPEALTCNLKHIFMFNAEAQGKKYKAIKGANPAALAIPPFGAIVIFQNHTPNSNVKSQRFRILTHELAHLMTAYGTPVIGRKAWKQLMDKDTEFINEFFFKQKSIQALSETDQDELRKFINSFLCWSSDYAGATKSITEDWADSISYLLFKQTLNLSFTLNTSKQSFNLEFKFNKLFPNRAKAIEEIIQNYKKPINLSLV